MSHVLQNNAPFSVLSLLVYLVKVLLYLNTRYNIHFLYDTLVNYFVLTNVFTGPIFTNITVVKSTVRIDKIKLDGINLDRISTSLI